MSSLTSSKALAAPCPTRRNGIATRLVAALSAALSVTRQRRQLAHLDADMLADIGLSAKEARDEASRAPWDVPNHWLR